MNPVFFGSRARQLFGVHVPATAGATRAAVICPPIGLEYQRAHRALRILSERLARAGVSTLRFDYYGTGDSFGSADEVRLDGCVEDARTAAEEMCAIAGLSRVTMIGLRVGAVIAARAASGTRSPSDGVVLWDPVVNGEQHVVDVRKPADSLRRHRPAPLPRALESDVRALDAAAYDTGRRRTLIIGSREADELDALRAKLDGNGRLDYMIQASTSTWVEEADLGVGAVPVQLIDRIVDWVGKA